MRSSPSSFQSTCEAFPESETGGITVLNLLILIACLTIGGLAIDFGNAMASKTQLQVTADSAAHAALYTRELNAPGTAKETALQIASSNMPAGKYGSVLTEEDIKFGDWDQDTQTFTVDSNSRDAVLVSTKRHSSNGNGVATFLLGLAGLDYWDITSASIFETYYPMCFREGFVAQDRVDMQSNGYFTSGFCIHSQSSVSVSSNNTYEPGVVVSMPDKRDIDLPSSGYSSNPGLAEALRDGSYQLRIINRIESIIQGAKNPYDPDVGFMVSSSPYFRSYLTSANIINVNYKKDITATTLAPGRIHEATCRQDKLHMTFEADAVMRNAVLITNCRVQIMAGAVIENAVIIVTSDEAKSVYAPSDIVIGKDDDCAEGGDTQIVTRGGVEFSAKVNIYGSQIIAAGDISMAANADGIEGASIISGGQLDVTSNGAFGFCGGNGMNNNFEAAYFRLAR